MVFLPLPSPRSRVFTKTEFTDVMCVFIFGVHLDTYSMRTRFLLKGSQYPGGGGCVAACPNLVGGKVLVDPGGGGGTSRASLWQSTNIF